MEQITTTGSAAATISETVKQPRPFVLALVLTGVLYFGVRQPLGNTNVAVSNSFQTNTTLSSSVKSAVMHDLSQREKLPESALQIVEARQLTWLNSCLNIDRTDVSCSKVLVPGWQITVASGKKRWVYFTNTSGSLLKLNMNNSTKPSSSRNTLEIAIASRKTKK
ncbi:MULTISPECIES: hypothetical protein [Aerosakkonema]|uniref:hypothetical protein n=1 Tax=Aerosakkonema TaxID=1246629 RepID=UPI0035B78ED1